jgi:exosortase family protein XrtF
MYQRYLNQFDEKVFEVDGFTKLVAHHVQELLSFFDSHSYTRTNFQDVSVKMFYRNTWVSRIIEGCNGMSVIILFISFVIAFTGKVKQTIVFITAGSLMIYLFNVVRIVLLCVAIFHFPKYEPILHGVIFPLFIYGVVFLLWIIWINNYSSYAKKTAKK